MGYLLDILANEIPNTRENVLKFMTVLSVHPLPIRYLVMHYLAADALLYSLEPCDRKDYLHWIVDLFTPTKFFSALACATTEEMKEIFAFVANPIESPAAQSTDLEDVIEMDTNSKRMRSRVVEGWRKFISTRDQIREAKKTDVARGMDVAISYPPIYMYHIYYLLNYICAALNYFTCTPQAFGRLLSGNFAYFTCPLKC